MGTAEHEVGAARDEAAEVDHALHVLAARGRAHELELARWLLRAEALAVHRRFGFGSLAQYVERRLGLAPRELREKLRVARALAGLPLTAEALRTGAQSWSAVRELTRVVTTETEAEWLAYGRGRTVRQLERRVARHRPGDTPRTRRAEAHVARRLVFEVPPEDLSKVRAALDAVWAALGPDSARGSPGGLLVAMAEVVLGQRDVSAPAYQAALTVCAGCARTWSRAGGEQVEVSDAVAGCARCDGEVVGFAALDPEDDALAEVGDAGARTRGATTHVGQGCESSAQPDGCPVTEVGREGEGADEPATHVGQGREASAKEPGARAEGGGKAEARPTTHVGQGREASAQPDDGPVAEVGGEGEGADDPATPVGHACATRATEPGAPPEADGEAMPDPTTHVGPGREASAREPGARALATHMGHACASPAAECGARGPATHVGHAHGVAMPNATSDRARASSATANRATHVGHATSRASACATSARPASSNDAYACGHHPAAASAPVDATTHVGRDAAALAYLRDLASHGGARPLLRVMTRALGLPLRSVTPHLRRLVFARDGNRCVVPGCGHWRFIDVHHLLPLARGGTNRLENLVCLCTAHHRAIHDGVLALAGSASEGWVVRHAGTGWGAESSCRVP
jgi:hypothetical protein